MNDAIKKYLLALELYCFRSITPDIVRKKYRELAFIFHPDISRKNTSEHMVLINSARDFVVRRISECNRVLLSIWNNKTKEFNEIYTMANELYSKDTSIEELLIKASLFRSILGFKDSEKKLKDIETFIKKMKEDEQKGQLLYDSAILDIDSSSISDLQKAIDVLKTIITYKDSENLIEKYNFAISEKIREVERIKKVYEDAKNRIKSDMTVKEIQYLLNELNKIVSYLDVGKLINELYVRLNQIGSIDLKLENERKEIIYKEVILLFQNASSEKDYQKVLKKTLTIQNYKDTQLIIESVNLKIKTIKEEKKFEQNLKIYNKAKKIVSKYKKKNLQKGINKFKRIKNFKDADTLMENARRAIIEIETFDAKTKMYNETLRLIQRDDLKLLKKAFKNFIKLDNFRDCSELANQVKLKIIKLEKNIYEQAKIDNIDKCDEIDLINDCISKLSSISNYQNSKELIIQYRNRIDFLSKKNKRNAQENVERKYQSGLLKADDEVTINHLNNKIKILNSVKGYKDANALSLKYKEHIRLLKKKEIAMHFRKHKVKYVLGFVALLLIISSSSITIVSINNKNHLISLIEDNNFSGAASFIQDNPLIAQKKKLEKINSSGFYLENGDYKTAIDTFTAAGGEVDVVYNTGIGKSTDNPTIFRKNKIDDPTADGYSSGKWIVNSFEFRLRSKYRMDLKLVSEYSDIITYTIKYHYNGGKTVNNPTSYNVETEDINLLPSSKTGYSFNGWYDNEEFSGSPISCIEKGSIGDIVLYAKWSINSYTITFDSQGGSEVESITKPFNESVSAPNEPSRKGYKFLGWFLEENAINKYSFTSMPGYDFTLYASWSIITYRIEYNFNGGIPVSNPTNYNIETDVINLLSPSKTGYSFNGWYDNEEFSGSPISCIEKGSIGNLVLYAKWSINSYTITFDSQGGSEVESITKLFSESVTAPNKPAKKGYEFAGWFLEENAINKYSFTSMPGYDLTLYASWSINTYTLEYKYNGGTPVSNPNVYNVETEDINLLPSSKTGYSFNGWYDNEEFSGSPISCIEKGSIGDIVLYAKWSINSYTITLEVNGGEYLPNINGVYNSEVSLPTPTREAYDFVGWYMDASFKNPATIPTMPAEDITIYAKWKYNNNHIYAEGNFFNIVKGTVDKEQNFVFVGYSSSDLSDVNKDIIFYKIDIKGNVLWKEVYKTNTTDLIYGIVTDQDCNIYFTTGHSLIFVKYNKNGDKIFERTGYGGQGSYYNPGPLAIDVEGNILNAACQSYSSTYPPSSVVHTTVNALNQNGDFLGTKTFLRSLDSDTIVSIKVDKDNNYYCAGNYGIFVRRQNSGGTDWTYDTKNVSLDIRWKDITYDDDGNTYAINTNNKTTKRELRKYSYDGTLIKTLFLEQTFSGIEPTSINYFKNKLVITANIKNPTTNIISAAIFEYDTDFNLIHNERFMSGRDNAFTFAMTTDNIHYSFGYVSDVIPSINNDYYGGINGFIWPTIE